MRAALRGLSLRARLLAATLVAGGLALVLAGALLARGFHDEVMRQFGSGLTAQLDQVTARLEFDADGRPVVDPAALSDPRWGRPYSGLYWQVDEGGAAGAGPQRRAVLRSRSLWDAQLAAPADALADGVVHRHPLAGPDGAPLLLLERNLRGGAPGATWRVLVAADLRETEAAVARFNRLLVASLAALGALLCTAALAQVRVGLAPLRALKPALAALRDGRHARLDGDFPAELQPLVADFNSVLDRNAEVVARARTQAGNLAHAIKTPLAALSQAASAVGQRPETAATLAPLVLEQVDMARRQVDWHLARARAAAAAGLPGARVALAPVTAGLLRVMARVHAGRGLQISAEPPDPALAFAGEVQDLQEMLGNLLDNACKWARSTVRLTATRLPTEATRSGADPASSGAGRARLLLVVQDDGPGIAASQRDAVVARGARLDESVPGSGLGLAIVQELAGLYGGRLVLAEAEGGGLRAELSLPAA